MRSSKPAKDRRKARTRLYGKIFDSIYEGTLYGQWEALVTFQQMIVLCDADGMIDMTPQAIAARTSIPLRIIKKGIAVLEAVDPYSRTPDQDGKRIELIDAHRPWGWHIVNHAKYMRLQDADMVRAQTRERVRKHRAEKAGVTVTDGNGQKRHTDTDIDIDTRTTNASRNARHAPVDDSPILEKLPLIGGREFEVRQSLVAELEPLYPAVDIPKTLLEMKGWLVLNVDRRKTRRGIRRFIGNWLQSEQAKHGG